MLQWARPAGGLAQMLGKCYSTDTNKLGGKTMSDWEFLYEMNHRGSSADDIVRAAGVGYAPLEEIQIRRQWLEKELGKQPRGDSNRSELKEPFRSRRGFPLSASKQAEILEDLIDCAKRHFQNTGRYLQMWGELGEIYAEVKCGLCRHASHHAGSDGTINGKLVEVKTLSPEKAGDQVAVKSQGDFEQLLVVQIDENFGFTSKLFNRNELSVGQGKLLRTRLRE